MLECIPLGLKLLQTENAAQVGYSEMIKDEESAIPFPAEKKPSRSSIRNRKGGARLALFVPVLEIANQH